MISIITSIFNQKPMNELFYNSLIQNTKNHFELIIIDNNSTDGSKEFFEKQKNTVVIENDGNYNYPYCQNIGIEAAHYDLLCFFNNDIVLSKNWDEKVLHLLKTEPKIKVLSLATNDRIENKRNLIKLSRRWKWIKYPTQFIFGNSKFSLKLMLYLMYGDFNKYSEKRFNKWKYNTIEGFSGSAIIMEKDTLSTVGIWDERIQAADFDLFCRVKKLSLKDSSILPLQVALGIYFHHYQRLTLKQDFPEFKNKDKMISLSEKWGDEASLLLKDIEE